MTFAERRARLLRIYATTARVVASYLWLRLRRPFLSDDRHAAALAARHRLNAARIRRAILSAGGLFIKVGQLISIMTNLLPPEFRGELEELQDRLPPRPFDEIVARVRAEFGRGPEELFTAFDAAPVATASLAQVHVAVLPDGRKVAVKAQHSDIEQTARADLDTIRRLLAVVQFFTGVRGLESYHPEISQMIAEELDFTKEAANIERVAANFAGDAAVRFPRVVAERSSRRVLTTEFVEGTKITDVAEGRRELAARVVAAYCRMIFVDGIYHADPHPGNILVAADGAIVFVDFGAVGVLAPHMKAGIPAFVEGMIRRDPDRVTEAIRTMGFVARDASSVDVARRVIDYAQRRFLDDVTVESWKLADIQVDMRTKLEALADLRKLDVSFRQLTAAFQVPKDWVLLERTLLLLVGLCTELEPSWNPMTVIRPYLEDVVLGKDRDWSEVLRGAVAAMARRAVTLPDDLQRALDRLDRGELQVKVPELERSARIVYAGAHQLIYCVLATASGVLAYQAYDRGRETLAEALGAVSVVLLVSLFVSMRRVARGR
jgi:ubiquinone biosynthesis protein